LNLSGLRARSPQLPLPLLLLLAPTIGSWTRAAQAKLVV
jgi:hypothetical protein